MVRRMRERLDEATTALRNGAPLHKWSPVYATRKAIRLRHAFALRWLLLMTRKEWGENFAIELERDLLNSEQGGWVRSALADP